MVLEKSNMKWLYVSDGSDNAAGNEKYDTSTLMQYTVPAGKRWFVLTLQVYRDNSSTLDIRVKDSLGQYVMYLDDLAAGTGFSQTPSSVGAAFTPQFPFPCVLDAGNIVHILFGSAQGAGGTIALQVLEVSL